MRLRNAAMIFLANIDQTYASLPNIREMNATSGSSRRKSFSIIEVMPVRQNMEKKTYDNGYTSGVLEENHLIIISKMPNITSNH